MVAAPLAETTVSERTLGRSGVSVSAIGLGCWAIGGPFWGNGKPRGWGTSTDRKVHGRVARLPSDIRGDAPPLTADELSEVDGLLGRERPS